MSLWDEAMQKVVGVNVRPPSPVSSWESRSSYVGEMARAAAESVARSKPKGEDKALIAKFQSADPRAGKADGIWGAGTAAAAALYVWPVPPPRYWPKDPAARRAAEAKWNAIVAARTKAGGVFPMSPSGKTIVPTSQESVEDALARAAGAKLTAEKAAKSSGSASPEAVAAAAKATAAEAEARRLSKIRFEMEKRNGEPMLTGVALLARRASDNVSASLPGKEDRAVIREFQRAAGIKDDGAWGPETSQTAARYVSPVAPPRVYGRSSGVPSSSPVVASSGASQRASSSSSSATAPASSSSTVLPPAPRASFAERWLIPGAVAVAAGVILAKITRKHRAEA